MVADRDVGAACCRDRASGDRRGCVLFEVGLGRLSHGTLVVASRSSSLTRSDLFVVLSFERTLARVCVEPSSDARRNRHIRVLCAKTARSVACGQAAARCRYRDASANDDVHDRVAVEFCDGDNAHSGCHSVCFTASHEGLDFKIGFGFTPRQSMASPANASGKPGCQLFESVPSLYRVRTRWDAARRWCHRFSGRGRRSRSKWQQPGHCGTLLCLGDVGNNFRFIDRRSRDWRPRFSPRRRQEFCGMLARLCGDRRLGPVRLSQPCGSRKG